MILNEAYEFSDVRYLIGAKRGERMRPRDANGKLPAANLPPDIRPIGYDVELSFVGYPEKKLFYPGTILCRLDFPVRFGLFMNVWWMRREVMDSILNDAAPDAAGMRQAWQDLVALPKAKGTRTQIVEIKLTQQVFGWIGKASSLYNRRGSAEQVYLPNLARGSGPDRSDFAMLNSTKTLPAI